MKHFIFLALILSLSLTVLAQNHKSKNQIQEVIKTQCTNFYITPPLKDLASEDYLTNPSMTVGKEKVRSTMQLNPDVKETPDPIRQTSTAKSGGGIVIEVNDTGLSGGLPPDPSGAIGPNHYVQAVNSVFRVYDTNGEPIINFPVALNSLWSGSSNDGDPIVMYDEYADRWFISQLQTESNSILIAISATPDPSEEYYAYEFNLEGFPDYPKYSIWGDAYYMSANSSGHDVVAFEREKMIAGDSTASMIALNALSTPIGDFYSMLPADADGALPPSGTPCYYFFPGDDSWMGNDFDHIKIYEMSIDWNNPSNSSISLDQKLEVGSFNANFTPSREDIDQPETSQKLDALQGIFTYRAQYRRWVGYNTLVLAMAVDVDGNDHAGIRWYELRQDDNEASEPGDWYVYQQGTFSPDDDLNRWIPSIAMDDFGNIALIYNICGESMAASIAICGRRPWDPLGELSLWETIVIEGSGVQQGSNRFGDYNHLTVAPDGETFWGTAEYISIGARRTRVFSFKVNDPLSSGINPEQKIEKLIYQSGSNIMVELNTLPTDDKLVIDVLDAKGALISSAQVMPINRSVSEVLDANKLSRGSYFIRIGNSNYQVVEKLIIQ